MNMTTFLAFKLWIFKTYQRFAGWSNKRVNTKYITSAYPTNLFVVVDVVGGGCGMRRNAVGCCCYHHRRCWQPAARLLARECGWTEGCGKDQSGWFQLSSCDDEKKGQLPNANIFFIFANLKTVITIRWF